MDEVIETSKEMMTDSESSEFWPVAASQNVKEGGDDQNSNETEDAERVINETTAHPFAPPLLSSSMDQRRRTLEMQMLPKRIVDLNRQLKDMHRKLDRQKEATESTMTYWKGKTKEISTKNTDLAQRMEVCICFTVHFAEQKWKRLDSLLSLSLRQWFRECGSENGSATFFEIEIFLGNENGDNLIVW